MSRSKPLIPYGRHSINEDDIAAVVDVLEHHFLTQGQKVPEFEQALSEYTGARHVTVVNSATSGLHVACMALGVGPGDVVWTVPNSFVASANCALYCNASVDFVDIDAITRNISIDALQAKLEQAKKQGRLPKVLIPVHFSGASCDMRAIARLAQEYQFKVIEDAAHGLGGSYLNRKIGCAQYSDIAVTSFHPVKSITTAEGGALLTNNAELDTQIKLLAKHGITRDADMMEGQSDGPWYYQQVALGYNYRLSDLQAALGISQLARLDGFIEKRHELALNYLDKMVNLPLKLPKLDIDNPSAWHLFMVELTHHERLDVYQKLHGKGIGVNVHYIPIHLQPYYQRLGFAPGSFPNAEHFYQNALTVPLFPDMTADEQERVIRAFTEVLG